MARLIAVRAPGRVNLIGDHTDYNDGFVLPMAIDLETTVRGEAREDDEVVLAWGAQGDRNSERFAGAVRDALARRGRPPVGLDAEVRSTVPIAAGLSSSAALSVSLATALARAADFPLPPKEVALACQEAEREATGVPAGNMDQLASACGRKGCALLIDCRSLDIEPIPLPESVRVVVVHSGLPRVLADSAYAARRAACEAVASRLGLRALRDATPEQVADEPFARHVVSENARVLAAADALRRGDVTALGPLFDASHASLRADYEVSTPELDTLVAALRDSGALGARLTGAGFGGCVVALARSGEEARVAATASDAYRRATGHDPTTYLVRAADGAGEAA